MSTSTYHKQPPIWPIFLLGLILLLLFWGINMWLISGSLGNSEPEEAARAEMRIKNLADLHAENTKKLEEYAWVDRAQGRVQIPIKQAMECILPELNASRPHAAYPIVTSNTLPSMAPATPTP